jgi:hypothetical protein
LLPLLSNSFPDLYKRPPNFELRTPRAPFPAHFGLDSARIGADSRPGIVGPVCVIRMAEAALEGSQPVDLSKHPSGIVPTLQ